MKLRTICIISILLLCIFALSGVCKQHTVSNKLGDEMTGTIGGAVPEQTKAEKVSREEEELQKKMADLSRVVDKLDKQIRNMRSATSAPTPQDIERLDSDLQLVEQELSNVSVVTASTLVQLQRAELQDKIFELHIAREILGKRWRGDWQVFGLDFFKNALPNYVDEQRAVPKNYRVRTGDKLQVIVLSNLGAQNEYHLTVDNSGSIVVPGAGRLIVTSKTAAEIEKYLESKLSSRFNQLQAQVTVEKLSSIQVQVAGEATRPGTYTLSGLATVMNALYAAGGPTKSASLRKISLVRVGEPKRSVDLYDFLLSGNKDQDYPLEDGDLIFIPPVGATIVVDGEVVRPGRYEPIFPITLAEALDMAGGPRAGGYLQTVQVERVVNNQYKVLLSEPLTGEISKSSFVLKPGDEVTVSPIRQERTNQISISGPVVAPGMYGFKAGMSVRDLILMAQGLAADKEVYSGRADIVRIDPLKGTQLLSFNLEKAMKGEEANNLSLQKLDRVFIYEPDQVVFRPRLVTVTGAVANPGTYKRAEGMRVSDAVAAAGGVLPQAYLTRADLVKRNPDETTKLVRVDLRAAMTGDPEANVALEDRDELRVYRIDEVKWQDHTVRIEGAVQRPGVYPRSVNMRVSDLLFVSGGLLPEAAATAELARSVGDSSKLIQIDLKTMQPLSESDMLLEDLDLLTVPSVNAYLRSPEIVYVTGEVDNPGPYALNKRGEKLASLIERAGGLTTQADKNGLLFLRQKESLENSQKEEDVDLILAKAQVFADKQFLTQLAKMGVRLPETFMQSNKDEDKLSKPSEVVVDEHLQEALGSNSEDEAPNGEANDEQVLEAFAKAGDRKEQKTAFGSPIKIPKDEKQDETDHLLRDLADSSRISVNLISAIENPSSADNLPLRNGDKIYIPKITNVVTVIGAVLHPHAFAARSGQSAMHYIERSGGFAQDAAREHVIVVRANGDALPSARVKSVEPGDTIVVPNSGLIDIAKKWEKVGTVTKVISDVLSAAFVLTRF